MLNRILKKQRCLKALVPFLLLASLLVLFAGPGILLTYPLQRWASRQIWDVDDRWETIWCFAAFGWFLYLPLILFPLQFVHTWQQFPFLGPATFTSLRFRSFLLLFLVPTATLLLEKCSPRTSSELVRVKRPDDAMQQAVSPAPVSTESVSRKKNVTPKPKVPHFLSLTAHRPAAETEQKGDPRPPGEVVYEEKQRRLERAKQASTFPLSSPSSAQKTINWDEGEGTYSEK